MKAGQERLAVRTKGREAGSRIDWCDVYKGISICLVVLTHATFEFNRYLNQYIYQFVIAGLFFISGYTAKIRNRPVKEELVRKFYRLMVPYYVLHFAGLWIFWALHQMGILRYISTTQYNVGYGKALIKLLEGNNFIYCDWLGAMWFVPVLFLAETLFAVMARIFRKDSMLCLASLAVFLGAEWLSARTAVSGRYYYSIDLAGIAQAFLVSGYLFHKIEEKDEEAWMLLLKALLIWGVWWGCIQLGFRYTFDWPARNVNGPVDLVLPFFGILLTVTVSRLFAKNVFLKRLFLYLGQNSMGIMCFHFIGFKAAYLILILLGKLDAAEAYRLIPSPVMAGSWPLIFVMGIAVGVLLWQGLNRISFMRLLLGGGNAGQVYSRLKEGAGRLRGLVTLRFLKWAVLTGVLGLILFCGIRLYLHSGRIEITFPYAGTEVNFEGEWLPQSDTEDYRWMEGRAEVKTFLTSQKEMEIRGYIPDTVADVTCLSIRMNGEELYRQAAVPGQLIELHLELAGHLKPFRRNTFEIEIDGVRIPGETDVDQRRFSAFFDKIVIY